MWICVTMVTKGCLLNAGYTSFIRPVLSLHLHALHSQIHLQFCVYAEIKNILPHEPGDGLLFSQTNEPNWAPWWNDLSGMLWFTPSCEGQLLYKHYLLHGFCYTRHNFICFFLFVFFIQGTVWFFIFIFFYKTVPLASQKGSYEL